MIQQQLSLSHIIDQCAFESGFLFEGIVPETTNASIDVETLVLKKCSTGDDINEKILLEGEDKNGKVQIFAYGRRK